MFVFEFRSANFEQSPASSNVPLRSTVQVPKRNRKEDRPSSTAYKSKVGLRIVVSVMLSVFAMRLANRQGVIVANGATIGECNSNQL